MRSCGFRSGVERQPPRGFRRDNWVMGQEKLAVVQNSEAPWEAGGGTDDFGGSPGSAKAANGAGVCGVGDYCGCRLGLAMIVRNVLHTSSTTLHLGTTIQEMLLQYIICML